MPRAAATAIDSDNFTQHRTTAAAAGVHKPNGAMNSAFDVTPPPKSKRAVAPPVDIKAVEIRKGIPLPAIRTHGSNSLAYQALLDKLKPGDSVVLLAQQARGLGSFAKSVKVSVALRKIDAQHIGVWRLADIAAKKRA